MNVLVTGIAGFVGGYLCKVLHQEGYRVLGTKLSAEQVDETVTWHAAVQDLDLADKEELVRIMEVFHPDAVIHLAAQSSVALSWQKPELTFSVNVNGTINLLESIRKVGIPSRVLMIGSSEEYGIVHPEEVPIKETNELRPGNPYAVSKITQEYLGKLYADSYHMNIIMVRAFNHTGPRQQPIFVIPDFARRLALMEKGLLEPVLQVGNLEAIRDFSDVRDIVQGYLSLIQRGKNGMIYNIGSGRGVTVRAVLDKLMSLATIPVRVQSDLNRMRPSDNPELVCDYSRLKQDTGWEPQINLEKTLLDIMNYWREVV